MTIQIEHRYLKDKPLLKRNAQQQGNNSPGTLVGYASVFNVFSEDFGWFQERIMPGAFDKDIADRADVRALVDHDTGKVIGRTTNDTLKLSTDEHGLKAEIILPDTTIARDLALSIERGDIDAMSFGFVVRKEQWTHSEEEDLDTRDILDVELWEVSAVAFPAYTDTTIAKRSWDIRQQQNRQSITIPLSVRRARHALENKKQSNLNI